MDSTKERLKDFSEELFKHSALLQGIDKEAFL